MRFTILILIVRIVTKRADPPPSALFLGAICKVTRVPEEIGASTFMAIGFESGSPLPPSLSRTPYLANSSRGHCGHFLSQKGHNSLLADNH